MTQSESAPNKNGSIQNVDAEVSNPKSKIANRKLEYGFKVASYDRTKDLIIDPLLASTYLGASGNENEGSDYGNAIAIDTEGNVYVTGYTDSSNFPTTKAAYDISDNGNGDYEIFISKLSGDLTTLIASTYLGGSSSDCGYSIVIDSRGNIYVTGYTSSSDFPTTTDAYDESHNSEEDIFISKFDANLTSLLASTFFGGANSDYGNPIAVDPEGNVYITGYTYSADFPTTTDTYDTSYNNSPDVFVSKLNGDLTILLASTYLGGSNSDYGYSIAIDPSRNVYVAGYTYSSDFPATQGVYDTSYNDSGDVFVSRLNGNLSSLLASTYLGGANSDYGSSISLDASGHIYVTGCTFSSDFPTIQGAYDTHCCDYSSYSWEGGEGEHIFGDTFVLKLNGSLTSLLASTYLGGSDNDYGNSISVDTSGNVYVVGYTSSSDFPTTQSAYSTSSGYHYISCDYSVGCDENYGNYDVFISKLNGELTTLLSSTCLGGGISFQHPEENPSDYNTIAIDSIGNIYVAGYTNLSSFPTTTGVYDTSYNGNDYYNDVFISKLSGDLTSLLASTYLGGSEYDFGVSIAIDVSGNVYVTGYTQSSDFPTTTGAYGTSSYNDNYSDVFVSKLNGDLTSLLASSFLGGSSSDVGKFITLDSSRNVYVVGYTYSSDFPTTTDTYDTSYSNRDAFISKLDGGLTTLLASTYLGGSGEDYGYSLALDTSGNVYVTGSTTSSDFPTTTGANDTSYNVYGDVFVSKLSGDLTSLLASTFLGGSAYDSGSFIAIDSIGNVYVAGDTSSPNFPITPYAMNAYYGANTGAYISKFDNNLTNLLSSTYLKSDVDDCISTDSAGNVYVAGSSSILKINDNLTRLLDSAFLGRYINSLALDSDENIYVAGYTNSTEFPITTGAYDTYNAGDHDAFVSKFDSNLSSTSPTVTTGTATDIKSTSATLNGSVNANGASTDVWFEYDTTSGSYTNTTSTQFLSGLNGTDTVSIEIGGLSPETTYYYRLVAQNNMGISYGSETSFATNTTSPPTVITGSATDVTNNSANINGTVNANEFLTTVWFEYGKDSGSYSNTSSTASVSGSDNLEVRIDISGLSPETTYYYRIAAQNSVGTAYGNEMSFTTLSLSKGSISGYVSDTKGNPIEFVKLMLKGKKTKIVMTSFSNSDGFFEFTDLEADTYVITATKKGYKRAKRSIKLEEGEEKEINIVMKKTSKKVR